MKRLLLLAGFFAVSFGICHSQVIKKVDIGYLETLADKISAKQKYEIDSLVISGYLHNEDFATLRDYINNGRLRGIDMSEAELDVIPEGAFASPKVNAVANSGGKDLPLTKIEYVTLPKDLHWIADRAFLMTALRYVSIPRVNSIGSGAFAYCPNLREVKIHQMDVPKTCDDVFGGLPDDATLLVPTGTADMFRASDGFSAFKRIEEREDLFKVMSFTLGEGLPTLAERLAGKELEVDSLTLTGYLTEADFAPMRVGCGFGRLSGIDMSGCRLKNDELPVSAFVCQDDDPYISTVSLYPRHRHPYYLRYIRFPESMKTIGDNALYMSKLNALELPPTVTTVGAEAFFRSEIGSGVKFPEGVKELKFRLFYESWINGDIYLPSTLERVGEHCFYPNYNHKDSKLNFLCNRLTPPETVKVNTDAGPFGFFKKQLPEGWTLYVPVGAKAAFEADKYWGKFRHIIETPTLDGGVTAGINGVQTVEMKKTDRIYTLDGRYLGSDIKALKSGVYVINGKKVVK